MHKITFATLILIFTMGCSSSQDNITQKQQLLYKLEDQSSFIEMQIPLYLEKVAAIADSTSNRNEASRAIFWKIATDGVFQRVLERSNSEYAFVDLWIFINQLNYFFERGNGIGYFNQKQNEVIELNRRLCKAIDERASLALTPEEYITVKQFVENESLQNTIDNIMLIRPTVKDAWFDFLGLKEKIDEQPKVKLPLVVSNASERINAQLSRNQAKDKDASSTSNTESPLLDEFRRKVLLDSLRAKIAPYLNSDDNTKEGIMASSKKLCIEITPYVTFLQERMQSDADRQEGFIVHNVTQIVERITASFWTHVNDTINHILYILILVGILIFTLPFFIGVWVGKIYRKYK